MELRLSVSNKKYLAYKETETKVSVQKKNKPKTTMNISLNA